MRVKAADATLLKTSHFTKPNRTGKLEGAGPPLPWITAFKTSPKGNDSLKPWIRSRSLLIDPTCDLFHKYGIGKKHLK